MRECGLPPLLTAPDCAAAFFLEPFHDLQYFPHVYRRHCRPSLFLPVFPQLHAFQSLLPQCGRIAQYPAESKSLESFRIQKLLSLLGTQQAGHAKIQRLMDGQWYRLEYSQDSFSFNNLDFSLGGENGSGLEGSIVQKYAHYGTRLEPGNYRVVLRMMSEDGIPHYLAEEFMVK